MYSAAFKIINRCFFDQLQTRDFSSSNDVSNMALKFDSMRSILRSELLDSQVHAECLLLPAIHDVLEVKHSTGEVNFWFLFLIGVVLFVGIVGSCGVLLWSET